MKSTPSRPASRHLLLLAASLILTLGSGVRAEEINLPELGSPSDQYLTPSA